LEIIEIFLAIIAAVRGWKVLPFILLAATYFFGLLMGSVIGEDAKGLMMVINILLTIVLLGNQHQRRWIPRVENHALDAQS